MSALMAGWYKMFGGLLNVKRVEDQMESSSGDQNQMMEEKEEVEEKSCCEETVLAVPEQSLQEQTFSLESVEQHDDLGGQDLKSELSQ